MDFTVPADRRVNLKESGKRHKYEDLDGKQKKTMEYKNESDSNCSWCALYSYQSIYKGSGNKRKGRDHPTTALLRSVRILRRVCEI